MCTIGDNAEYTIIGDTGYMTIVTINNDNTLYRVSGIQLPSSLSSYGMASVNYNGTTYAVVGGGEENGFIESLVRFIRFNGAGCEVEKTYTLTTGRKNYK